MSSFLSASLRGSSATPRLAVTLMSPPDSSGTRVASIARRIASAARRASRPGAAQQDGELPAAVAGRLVDGASVVPDGLGDGAQDGVALQVAVGVVDGLKLSMSRMSSEGAAGEAAGAVQLIVEACCRRRCDSTGP